MFVRRGNPLQNVVKFCCPQETVVVVVVYSQQVFEESFAATEDSQSLPLRNELNEEREIEGIS